MNPFADTAPGYLAVGFQPVPLHVPADEGCSCDLGTDCASAGKHPRVAWPEGQRIDEEQVRRWARRWPAANVGIITGAVSNTLVVDVDPAHGGVESLARLERRFGALPATLASRTGSGGLHIVFAHPGVRIGPSAGKLGAGLDIRADRGLIVAPPSLHVSGRRYQWVVGKPGDRLTPAPPWVVTALTTRPEHKHKATVVTISGDCSAFAKAILDRAAEKVRHAPNGAKHDVLWRQAFHLGTWVGAGLLDESTAEQVLLAALGDRAKSERAAAATVRRNLAAGQRKPAQVAS